MRKVQIHFKYPKKNLVFFFDNLKDHNFIKQINKSKYRNCIIFCDRNVYNLFKNKIKKIRKKIFLQKLYANENLKHFKNVKKIISYFEKKNINKSDLVLVIGGGTVSDLISFCCSIYMRGISFWSIPTTLMSQVDALSAGKTCINTDNSKNTVGNIYFSEKVFLLPELNISNNYINFRQGLSEIFKYGLLSNSQIINLIDKNFKKPNNINYNVLKKIIRLTISTRAKISKKHSLASNLGHTFGHAIEKIFNNKIKHGDAISSGIYLANYFSLKKKLMSLKEFKIIENLMIKSGLNLWFDNTISMTRMISYIKKDKKNYGNNINLVLIKKIGLQYKKRKYYFYKTSEKEIFNFLSSTSKWHKYLTNNLLSKVNKKVLEYK
jgi:3-dehydroquinate synthase